MNFYFDYISPYAYIAWTRIHALAEKHGRIVTPVPILLGALLSESGRLGPAETPLMRRWVFKNVLRKCNELKIPLSAPATHPFNPLLALRATALDMTIEQQHRLIDLLFEATWATGQDVTDPAVVGELLTQVGLNPEEGLAQVQQPEIKDRIRTNTAQALAEGTFGVPTVVVDGELFWGHDDLVFLDKFLDGEAQVDENDVIAWENVEPSIQRRR